MTPPNLSDSEGLLFKLLGPITYRPTDYSDWREMIEIELERREKV